MVAAASRSSSPCRIRKSVGAAEAVGDHVEQDGELEPPMASDVASAASASAPWATAWAQPLPGT